MPALRRNQPEVGWLAKGRFRSGATIAELAVVLALIGLLGSAIGVTLLRQQRFYRGTAELLHAREGVRDAMELLSTDLRGMSVADTVRLLADSAIEFFANIGSSVVCNTAAGVSAGLPGRSPGRGNALTSFLILPDTGDVAVFHRDSLDGASEWERHHITGFAARSLAVACAESDATGSGFLVELSTPLSAHVKRGSPVRFVRRGRYSLYHASDGRWYLGYRRCNAVGASSCGAIQPLSGPYSDYKSDSGNTGLLFEYFDASGNRLTQASSPLAIARVDISARAESRHRIIVGNRVSAPGDSATVSIAIRNR
jgi:hypothetical protein